MWCTWCFNQGLVNWRDSEAAVGCRLSAIGCRLSAIGCRLSAVRCPLSDVRCPMAAGTVFPKVDTPYGQALTGLRVDGPLGRRFLRGLSLTRLWREGCGRAPLNYRRRPLMKKPPWRASENRPTALVGEGDSPLWWLTPPPCPRKRGHYKAPLCCERLMKGMLRGVLFFPLNRGKSGEAG